MGGGSSKSKDPNHTGDAIFLICKVTFESQEKLNEWVTFQKSRDSNFKKIVGNEVWLKTGDLELHFFGLSSASKFLEASAANAKDFQEKEDEKKYFAYFSKWEGKVAGNVTKELKENLEGWTKDPRITFEFPTAEVHHAFYKTGNKGSMMFWQRVTVADEEAGQKYLKHFKTVAGTIQKNRSMCCLKTSPTTFENYQYSNNEEWKEDDKNLKGYEGIQEWIGSMKDMNCIVIGDLSEETQKSMDGWSKAENIAVVGNPADQIITAAVNY